MPTNMIKKDAREGKGTVKSLEKKWDKAKDAAGKKDGKQNWALTNYIYQRQTKGNIMPELNAASRLKASVEVDAKYTGTKVKDLAAYVKELEPGIRLSVPGPGGTRSSAGMLVGLTTAETAHSLGSKLVKDGWVGRRVTKKLESGGTTEYIVYLPKNMPKSHTQIKLSKPGSDGRVRIALQVLTNAAINERGEWIRRNKNPKFDKWSR